MRKLKKYTPIDFKDVSQNSNNVIYGTRLLPNDRQESSGTFGHAGIIIGHDNKETAYIISLIGYGVQDVAGGEEWTRPNSALEKRFYTQFNG